MVTLTRMLALTAFITLPVTPVAHDTTGQAPNPELVGQLAKELGSSNEQATGAAGALFGLAKTRLNAADFSKVSAVVPGMGGLLAAAPAMGAMGALTKGGGLSSLAGAFSKLGLKPDQIGKAASFLTQYVTKAGGPAVGALLAGAFK